MNKKAPIALLMFLLILVTSGFAIARFRENKQPTKEYHNYNPVTEVSQERLKTHLKLAKAQRDGFKEANLRHINEGRKEIEALEGQIKETEANNARLQVKLNKLDVSRAVKRMPVKSVPQKNFTGNIERWRPLVAKYFPANQVNNALAVMKGESGGDPNEVNDNPKTKDYSVGLFQINLYGNLAKTRPSEAWLLIPENNVAYASRVWKNQGWSPWSAARKIGL